MSRRRNEGRGRRRSDVSLEACRQLERDSNVPLYYQLSATLLETIETGPWREGVRFATEREIEAHFGVSRVVVRRALDLLEGDGAIVRRKGAGAFVARRRSGSSVFGVVDTLTGGCEGAKLRVFGVVEEEADSAVASFLRLGPEERRICHLTARLGVEGRPLGLIDSHLPISRLPWILGAALASARGEEVEAKPVTPTRAEVVIEHSYFGSWGGPKLGARAGDPALMTRLILFGRTPQAGREAPLEFARLFYPARTAKIQFIERR